MKISVMKLFIIDGLIGVYDLDHKTTPDVVNISKVSNMVAVIGSGGEGGGLNRITTLRGDSSY